MYRYETKRHGERQTLGNDFNFLWDVKALKRAV
jgi:hypothetical protein